MGRCRACSKNAVNETLADLFHFPGKHYEPDGHKYGWQTEYLGYYSEQAGGIKVRDSKPGGTMDYFPSHCRGIKNPVVFFLINQFPVARYCHCTTGWCTY